MPLGRILYIIKKDTKSKKLFHSIRTQQIRSNSNVLVCKLGR